MTQTENTTRLQLTLPSELVLALTDAAKKDVRTVSGFLQVLLTEHLALRSPFGAVLEPLQPASGASLAVTGRPKSVQTESKGSPKLRPDGLEEPTTAEELRPDGQPYEPGFPREVNGRIYHTFDECADAEEVERKRIAALPPLFSPERLAEIAAYQKENAEENKRLGIE